MNEKQQTAVQWLMEEIYNEYTEVLIPDWLASLLDEAIARERKQIEDAWTDGWLNGTGFNKASNFYNDTYQTDL